MTKPTLCVTQILPDKVMEALRQRFRLVAEPLTRSPTRGELEEMLSRADALLCTLADRIDEPLLAKAPYLKVIANYAVGYNNVEVEAARERRIVVTNTPDVLTDATADLTWALLLAAARRVVEGDTWLRTGEWNGWRPTQMLGADVTGKVLGIVGLGRIGQAVARRAAGFRMPVLYAAKRPCLDSTESSDWSHVPFTALLERADFVSIHVPLTDTTRHLIGAPEFAVMKPTSIFINTSRGAVVDELALVSALQTGRIAGAGLDVYEREPILSAGLSELPNVVLLPHLGSATLNTRVQMGMICLENILAVFQGRPVPNRVV